MKLLDEKKKYIFVLYISLFFEQRGNGKVFNHFLTQ
jgi:hypothetical protein